MNQKKTSVPRRLAVVNALTRDLKRSRPPVRDYVLHGDFTPAIASAFAQALLLILAVANFRHDLVDRAHDRIRSLFRNSMIAILNDNLFSIRRKELPAGMQPQEPPLPSGLSNAVLNCGACSASQSLR